MLWGKGDPPMTPLSSFLLAGGCAIALGALLHAEAKGRRSQKIVAKPLASLCFLGVALALGPFESPGGTLLFAGLVLGAVGDVTLLGPGTAAFLGGLGAFLFGHVAYVLALARLAPPETWVGLPLLGVLAFGAGALRWLWPHLGPLRVPVIGYVVVICAMVVAALAAAPVGGAPAQRLALGAVLFAVSDLAVARERFIEDTFRNKVWGLPLYYAGQLLIAFSVGGVP
jgi:uncharacterized membrane protein YhhN